MKWASLVVTALKLVGAFISFLNDRKLLKAGEDRAIAQQALKVLESTQDGKVLRQKVKSLDSDKADKLWDDLVT